jgi:hypothetical protein
MGNAKNQGCGTLLVDFHGMKFRFFWCLLSMVAAPLSHSAQERVTIHDPELSFSYLLPKGWLNYDDDYYHYILNADSTVQIALTYYDGMCQDLSTCYTGELDGRLRSEYSNFTVLGEFQGSIAAVPAQWAAFTGRRDGIDYFAYAYYLIWKKQFFKIVAYLPIDASEALIGTVGSAVESLGLELR